MGRWATCSALERVAACPASAALPQTRDVSNASEDGRRTHEALERACEPGTEEVLTPGGVVRVEELRLPNDAQAEICFSWDVVTGEAQNHGKLEGARAYPPAAYSVLYGTSDVFGTVRVSVGDEEVTAAFIGDYKTGHPNYLPESDGWQFRSLAMMSAKAMGLRYAITRVIGVRDGFVTNKPQRLWLPEELDETERQLRRIYDAVNRAARKGVSPADVVHGYHCAFCPAFAGCPYMASVLSGGRLNHLDTRDIAQAYSNWQAVKTAEKRLEAAVKAAAGTGPIDLGGGYFYGRYSGQFRKFRKAGDE